jgi:Ni/Fe-hydrogenase subunit HybB-like protein
VGVGVLSFAWGLGTDPDRAYRVFLHNWLLWAALAQGALVLSAAFRLTNAGWQGPIHRLVDSLGAFVPLSLLLFVVVFVGRHELYHWIHDPGHVAGKEWWYRETLFLWRDTLGLLWMTFISAFYYYLSLRPTLARARETATGWRKSLIDAWTAGWRGEEREQTISERRSRKLAAVLALSYTLVYSLLSVDLIMSLSPHWVSTMFPAYYAWGGFLSAVSLTAVVALLLRNGEQLRGEITPARMHDMGKMVFAFSIFWMYLFWSQYLVIWYGNIPEETEFVVARLGSQFIQDTWYLQGFWTRLSEPYAKVTLLAWILLWVLPFWVLLGQRPKKTPAILGAIATGSVFGFWIERYVLVTPSLVAPEAVLAGAPITPLGGIEIGIGLGFLGLFFLCFLVFSRVFPGVLPPRT